MKLRLMASLPDGEIIVGNCLYKDRLIIACQSGKLFEVVPATGSGPVSVEKIPVTVKQASEAIALHADTFVTRQDQSVDLTGIKAALDSMVRRGEAEYPGHGGVQFYPAKICVCADLNGGCPVHAGGGKP